MLTLAHRGSRLGDPRARGRPTKSSDRADTLCSVSKSCSQKLSAVRRLTWMALQAERIAKHRLIERAFELLSPFQARSCSSLGQLHEEVRGSLGCTAPAYADEMLDYHRLVARGRPQKGRSRGAETR